MFLTIHEKSNISYQKQTHIFQTAVKFVKPIEMRNWGEYLTQFYEIGTTTFKQ